MRSRALGRTLIALVAVAVLAALAGTAQAASAAVAIDGFRFLPQSVTVNVGETVTWTNRDPAQHTATAPGTFDTGVLAMGQSRTLQMNAAGTFEYRCAIHGAMTGTVLVIAAATATPVPTTARPPTATPTVAPTAVATPTPAPATAPPTPSPTTAPTTEAPAASPSPRSTPGPTSAQTAVSQASPTPRSGPAAPPDGGPGLTLAIVAGVLAAGAVSLGIARARRR